MAPSPRPCSACGLVTRDLYVINEYKHPRKGESECVVCHEARVTRETRELFDAQPTSSLGHADL